MIWAVADQRIIVWAFARRPGVRPVGSFDRADLRDVLRPTVGGAWRTLQLRLANGSDVSVQVGGDTADRVATGLRSSQEA